MVQFMCSWCSFGINDYNFSLIFVFVLEISSRMTVIKSEYGSLISDFASIPVSYFMRLVQWRSGHSFLWMLMSLCLDCEALG